MSDELQYLLALHSLAALRMFTAYAQLGSVIHGLAADFAARNRVSLRHAIHETTPRLGARGRRQTGVCRFLYQCGV